MKKTYSITGMSCAACSSKIQSAVGKMEGVSECDVNLLLNKMTAEFDENKVSNEDIAAKVTALGYGIADSSAKSRSAVANPSEERELLKRFIVSLCFLLPLMYVAMGSMLGFPLPEALSPHANPANFILLQTALTIPVMLVNRKFFVNGIKAVFKRAPNMDSLVALGSGAAFVYGIVSAFVINVAVAKGDSSGAMERAMNTFFESSAMILTLVTLGKYFEAKSKGQTKKAVEKLLRLSPDTAVILRDGNETVVPASEISVGDTVVLRPGDYVPVDGVVIGGDSSLDLSAITGESMPVTVGIGDAITSAAVNLSGNIRMKAEKVGKDSTIAKIIELVENAGGSKAPVAKLADKVAGVFVPVVFAIAVVTLIVWLSIGYGASDSLNYAISVLVISCPCALGLATPVAVMAGTGRGAEMGVLFKNAEVLEKLHSVKTVLLDKTATITEGKPRVKEIRIFSGSEENEIVSIAAALESGSSHPIAAAVLEYAREKGITPEKTETFEYTAGLGITGRVNGTEYRLGNKRLLEGAKIPIEQIPEDGNGVYLASDRLLGELIVEDGVKADSASAVIALKSRGLKVAMLTGDNAQTARRVAEEVGIETVYPEVLPENKLQIVTQCQHDGLTAMVGDGINDAPALKQADVGIAIGSGTDVAVEAADVVLVKDSLSDVDHAIALSKRTMKIIKQNLFWAFFYNTVGIPIAAGVLVPVGVALNPMIAAAAMSLSSVCVVLNALRLRTFMRGGKKQVAESGLNSAGTDKNIINDKGECIMNITKTMKISGMSCGHCSGRVQSALNAIEGVSAKVDLASASAVITIDDSCAASDADLIKAVADAGYEVESLS